MCQPVPNANPSPTPLGGELWFLLLVLLLALVLRLDIALTTTYMWDEERDWIRLATDISLRPGSFNLPVHGFHPALPAYFIRTGSLLLGANFLGFRLLSLIAGILTILMAFRLAGEVAGVGAARWAAILLTFCEYHVQVSAIATEKAFYLAFSLLAIYAFCRFLRTEKPHYLYITAVSAGLGFLCKETSSLLAPALLVVFCFRGYRSWFLRKEPYIAALLFLAVISPDLYWNLRHPAGNVIAAEYGYAQHLSRVGGLGYSVQPLIFYGR